jgi:acyl carrier protein
MSVDGVLAQVARIVAEILDNTSVQIREDTVARDVAGWDSLSNVQIILAVERNFGVRFTSREIQSFTNVGEMCASIREKLTGSLR